MARILAVDDDRAILQLLERALSRDGHKVECTDDPTSVPAMDLSRYDLILTDVMMPGLDGFELVRLVRDRFDGPIMFLTAKVAEDDAVLGLGLGADDYVRKPFGVAELRAKVVASLRRERRVRRSVLDLGRMRFDLGARELSVTAPDGRARRARSPHAYRIWHLRVPGQASRSRLQPGADSRGGAGLGERDG